jgi:hypothetical protein
MSRQVGDASLLAPSLSSFRNFTSRVSKQRAACTAPTAGGVAICSPQSASKDVNPVHYIAAASSPSCAAGIATISIQPKPGVTAYSVAGATLDTFLPLGPGTYNTTVKAVDKRTVSA